MVAKILASALWIAALLFFGIAAGMAEQQIERGNGVVCDSPQQVERFIALDIDTNDAIGRINAESPSGSMCEFIEAEYIVGGLVGDASKYQGHLGNTESPYLWTHRWARQEACACLREVHGLHHFESLTALREARQRSVICPKMAKVTWFRPARMQAIASIVSVKAINCSSVVVSPGRCRRLSLLRGRCLVYASPRIPEKANERTNDEFPT